MKANVVTASLTPAQLAAFEHREALGQIVCGIDGSPSALEAARQAGALAGPSATIELVAVADEWGDGLNEQALLGKERAQHALDEASAALAGCPARIVSRTLVGNPPWKLLLDEAAGADLLVVGRHGLGRVGGIMVGGTATNVVHRARVPVLVAVGPPRGTVFPGRILVAADGPDSPENAVRMAGVIAERTGADVTLLRLDWSRAAKRPQVARAIADLEVDTGREPLEILVGGSPVKRIAEYAEREHAGLVIVGSRRLSGLRALRSTSERVAHRAPCSVLIVRRAGPA
jgi:nucleotide-binding universal stress UspA family protein